MTNVIQDMGGAQISNVADPVNAQDAMTMNTAMATAGAIPRVNLNGVTQSTVWECGRSNTVSTGTVVFNLTADNTSGGTALFSTIFKESANFWIDDATNQYQIGGYTVSANKKTLTLTVNKIGLSLGIIVFTSAANGVVVNMTIKGTP